MTKHRNKNQKSNNDAFSLDPSKETQHDNNNIQSTKSYANLSKSGGGVLQGLLVAVSTRQDAPTNNSDNNDNNDNKSSSNPNPSSSSNTITTGGDDYSWTFQRLSRLCRDEAGASLTSQVHKRVQVVIATDEAIRTPATQRVRKAWQRNVPVVRVAWLLDSIQARRRLPYCDHNDKDNDNATEYRVWPPHQKNDNNNNDNDNDNDNTPRNPNVESQSSKKRSRRQNSNQAKVSFSTAEHKSKHKRPRLVEEPPPQVVVDLGCCCVCHDSDDLHDDFLSKCAWCTVDSCNVVRAQQQQRRSAEKNS